MASWSRQCRKLFGDSTGAAHHHGHLIPVVAQRLSLWLRLFSRPLRFHCCRFDVSDVQDRQVPRVQAWRRQPCPTLLSFAGADVENTFEIPQLQVVDAGLRTRPAGSTGAVVEKTIEIPQFRPVGARPRCAGQQVHRCSLRGDSRDPTVAARSCRSCSTLTRWSMSRLWFTCLSLFNDRCRDGCCVFLGPCAQAHGQG